jgi:hypothetical protein
MTFIASVVAKKGVAIIADSLVTSSLPILHYKRFLDHLKTKPKSEDGDISLTPTEIENLFKYEPIYTKDYEEKLFQLNKYTAITTTGAASINGSKIIDIVTAFKKSRSDLENMSISLEDKIDQFSEFVTEYIKNHLNRYEDLESIVFIISHYDHNPVDGKTVIYKMTISEVDKSALQNADYEYINIKREPEWAKVVCDGQNKLSDNVLYGIGKRLFNILPEITGKILSKIPIDIDVVPKDLIKQLREDPYFDDIFYSDVELLNLTNLSLQQAVDLASLLMRLEVDFQKYTKNVPTVGGVIKLAAINEEGFKPISGYDISPPRHITI